MGHTTRDQFPLAILGILLVAGIIGAIMTHHALGGAPWFSPPEPRTLIGEAANDGLPDGSGSIPSEYAPATDPITGERYLTLTAVPPGSIGQNLKVKALVSRPNDVGVEICKELDAPLNGTMDIRFAGEKEWTMTQVTIEHLKLCSSPGLQWTAFVHHGTPFNTTAPGMQKQLTVSIAFPSHYNANLSDDTLTAQVTLQ